MVVETDEVLVDFSLATFAYVELYFVIILIKNNGLEDTHSLIAGLLVDLSLWHLASFDDQKNVSQVIS